VNPRKIGFTSFFCQPGEDGAHEKGGVEGEIGRFRRRHLVPVPTVASLVELNTVMAAADAAEDARRIGYRRETVGAAAAREQPLLAALPATGFDPTRVLSCRVDTKARVCVRQSYYSAPAHLAGRRVTVRLGADTVTVLADAKTVATHVRSLHKGTETLLLDHYLEVLARKPGALAGATALVAARASGTFTQTHQRFWDAARRALGDGPGTRVLIAALLLHRTLPAVAVIAGMQAALRAKRFDPNLLAVDARHHVDTARPVAAVTTPAGLLAQARPAPSLHSYDELLTGASA
jgi:hypothetical protein